jgi:hypothetical protein
LWWQSLFLQCAIPFNASPSPSLPPMLVCISLCRECSLHSWKWEQLFFYLLSLVTSVGCIYDFVNSCQFFSIWVSNCFWLFPPSFLFFLLYVSILIKARSGSPDALSWQWSGSPKAQGQHWLVV